MMRHSTTIALLSALLLGSTAYAQVQGVPKTQSTAPTSSQTGSFVAQASINSVLNFTITDASLECGVVSASTTNCSGSAAISVTANANWRLSINNGLLYSTSELDYAEMTNDDPARQGSFTVDVHDSVDAAHTTQQPGANVTVTFTGTLRSSGTTVERVDPTDEHGGYTGYFVVVLSEMP